MHVINKYFKYILTKFYALLPYYNIVKHLLTVYTPVVDA